jgi:hypothetical protein
MSQWPRVAVRRTVEEVVKTLIKRTPDLRRILKQVMGLALVVELVRQEGNAANVEKRLRAGLHRIFELCRERYTAQEKHVSAIDDDPNSLTAQFTSDLADLYTSQDLNLDLFGFDSEFDPLSNINI